MVAVSHTQKSLFGDLISLGVHAGDGLFVHGSMSAVGGIVGGARTTVESLLKAVGETGLVGMPGFSPNAYFPAGVDAPRLTQDRVAEIEDAVPGFDLAKSPTSGMGVIAETFRNWPGTLGMRCHLRFILGVPDGEAGEEDVFVAAKVRWNIGGAAFGDLQRLGTLKRCEAELLRCFADENSFEDVAGRVLRAVDA